MAICPLILGVSGSFAKIERNAAIESPAAGTSVVALHPEHQRWTSATGVFSNGFPLFRLLSYVGWSHRVAPSALRGMLEEVSQGCSALKFIGYAVGRLKGFWCLLGTSD